MSSPRYAILSVSIEASPTGPAYAWVAYNNGSNTMDKYCLLSTNTTIEQNPETFAYIIWLQAFGHQSAIIPDARALQLFRMRRLFVVSGGVPEAADLAQHLYDCAANTNEQNRLKFKHFQMLPIKPCIPIAIRSKRCDSGARAIHASMLRVRQKGSRRIRAAYRAAHSNHVLFVADNAYAGRREYELNELVLATFGGGR